MPCFEYVTYGGLRGGRAMLIAGAAGGDAARAIPLRQRALGIDSVIADLRVAGVPDR